MNENKQSILMAGIFASVLGYGIYSINDYSIRSERNREKLESNFKAQGDYITLKLEYGTRGTKGATIYESYDLSIPRNLFLCYLDGKILSPTDVAKACGNIIKTEDIKPDTTLGYFTLKQSYTRDEIKPITVSDLVELRTLIAERGVAPSTLIDLKDAIIKRAFEEKSQPQSLNR
jgi:hypothetical protein